jgi:glycosyltransferase involved in cell wall biosynthesis
VSQPTTASTPLILVSGKTTAAAADGPRQDFAEIARRLHGKLLGYDLSDASWYQWTRQIERKLKLDIVEALSASRQARQHNLILSLSEKLAIPVATLMRAQGQPIPHIVIGHKLSSGLKTRLFRLWSLHQSFDHIICLCQAQADYAIRHLQVAPEKVSMIYDKVDHRYFHPQPAAQGDYILAVGQEQRDYETLVKAIAGTDIRLVIVASSPWSTGQTQMIDAAGVKTLSRIPFSELRDLYAGARLVVVPLFNVDYAAGVNAALEAMAMGRPLIISRTPGIADYVLEGETGCYAAPGDAPALREVILSLWDKPQERERLGTNGRQMVEERMNLDIYVEQIAQIVQRTTGDMRP